VAKCNISLRSIEPSDVI